MSIKSIISNFFEKKPRELNVFRKENRMQGKSRSAAVYCTVERGGKTNIAQKKGTDTKTVS